ncbi:enhancer of rudimentary homolog [Drosophila subobscura]|uniref:enhancer of rudimentary homolog n=1 Tax=Drosophila subobscura TaxID=7241 RepID=UPI00155AC468|nr:enhancer of rudimentary homolog [Drosophila subobscura]
MSRTILLIQLDSRDKSRSYAYFHSVDECLERVCKIYEEHLKRCTPCAHVITYDILQLFDFIDMLKDLTCLVFEEEANTYAPRNKDWIKNQISDKLRKEANKSGGTGETANAEKKRLVKER